LSAEKIPAFRSVTYDISIALAGFIALERNQSCYALEGSWLVAAP
jgi:hypothetical protein